MKRLFIVVVMNIIMLISFSVDSAAMEYQFTGQGLNGYCFAGRNTGLIRLEGEKKIDAYCLEMDAKLVSGAWYKSQKYDNERIKGILHNAYPFIRDLNAMKIKLNSWLVKQQISEVADISIETAVTAAQLAVWFLESKLDIGALRSDAKDEIKLAHYLINADHDKPPEPEIVIETVTTEYSRATETYNATFSYYISNSNGQAYIDTDKTKFNSLPPLADETVFTNGDRYTRVVKNIPAGDNLLLIVNVKKNWLDICLLTSEGSQALAGIIEKTIELNKFYVEHFPLPEKPAPFYESNSGDVPAKTINLPVEYTFGLATFVAVLISLLLMGIIRSKQKKRRTRERDHHD